MGFLDNSGDIILDAVLTKEGRRRLARGDGSFQIHSFGLGDPEIVYSLHDSTVGTAYQDLNILKTPILEAYTSDAAAGLKSHLITMDRNDILYMPILKLNTLSERNGGKPFATDINKDMYVVISTDNLYDAYSGSLPTGFIDGRTTRTAAQSNQLLRLEAGLDTTEVSFTKDLSAEFSETIYEVEADERFIRIVEPSRAAEETDVGVASEVRFNFVDQDNIAHYTLVGDQFFDLKPRREKNASIVRGPRDRKLRFGCKVTDDIANSNFAVKKYGSIISSFLTNTGASNIGGSADVYALDLIIRCTGGTVGHQTQIPIRIIRGVGEA